MRNHQIEKYDDDIRYFLVQLTNPKDPHEKEANTMLTRMRNLIDPEHGVPPNTKKNTKKWKYTDRTIKDKELKELDRIKEAYGEWPVWYSTGPHDVPEMRAANKGEPEHEQGVLPHWQILP